jgi:hypothetical protein
MRVRMIRAKSDKRPASIAARLPESQTFISTGKEYEVYAIAVFQGRISLQIVDDLPMINWYPAWFFEVSDSSMPNDWICSLLTGDLQMVLGPDFVAADEASYNRMVELESESVAAFWRRLGVNAQTGE